jgi:hypothetical protein
MGRWALLSLVALAMWPSAAFAQLGCVDLRNTSGRNSAIISRGAGEKSHRAHGQVLTNAYNAFCTGPRSAGGTRADYAAGLPALLGPLLNLLGDRMDAAERAAAAMDDAAFEAYMNELLIPPGIRNYDYRKQRITGAPTELDLPDGNPFERDEELVRRAKYNAGWDSTKGRPCPVIFDGCVPDDIRELVAKYKENLRDAPKAIFAALRESNADMYVLTEDDFRRIGAGEDPDTVSAERTTAAVMEKLERKMKALEEK